MTPGDGDGTVPALRDWKRRSAELDAERDALIRAAHAAGINIRQIGMESGLNRGTIYKILGGAAAPGPGVLAGLAGDALRKAGYREMDHYWTEPVADNPEVIVLHWVPRSRGSGGDLRDARAAIEALDDVGMLPVVPETRWTAGTDERMSRGKPVWIGL